MEQGHYNKYMKLYPHTIERYKNITVYQAVIRDCLESHSSDSRKFTGKEDLFYIVFNKGDGVWGLR